MDSGRDKLRLVLTVAFAVVAVAATPTAAVPNPNPHTCAGPGRTFAWCDHTLSVEARVSALVAALRPSEKAMLMVNSAEAVPRLGLPKYNWWSEALHGVARDGVATSFPQIIGVASSFNRSLFKALGELTGTEARGKNNNLTGQLYNGLTMWAPNVNIFRDPRWGRGQETPGEDPTLNGAYAENYVSGLQGNEGKNGYLRTSACLKHYAAYSEETGRNSFPAIVFKQDMLDTYLPAFQQGIEGGHASGLMCSYNAETYGSGVFGNGTEAQHGAIPSCANKGLLNDLIRDKWKFQGYVTSDCGAVDDVQNQHHYTNNSQDTVRAVLTAGMDTDCGKFMNQNVMSTFLAASSFNRELVDTALARLFHVQFRLGLFDPLELNPFGRLGPEVVDTPAHRRLAREAADQSLVLLKNNAKVLPLRSGNIKAVAVVGRNANATNNMQGNYFGTAPFLVSPLKGIAKHTHTKYADGNSLSTATQLAATADAVVLVVGLTSEAVHSPDEAEGHDRTSLTLPDNQDHYIAAVAKAAKAADSTKPVVLVIMGGGPVDVAQWRDSADVDAIIWVGYPGQSGGDAIADVLFGVTVPSGKLTQTWYPQSFADKVSILDMGMRPNKATGNPGRSYRFYTGDPVFKFGEGLSYTEFIHAGIVASRGVIAGTTGSQQVVHVTVDVQNSGDRDATEIVLVFAAPPDAGAAGAPLQQLVAFERVFIRTAQTKRVSFRIPEGKFSYAKKGASETVLGAKNWTLWTGVKEASTAVVKLQ